MTDKRNGPTITNLVLEGGGVKGISHVGVIKVLEDKQLYKDIKNFCGSSAGGLIATMAACGASAEYMKNVMMELDFNNLKDSYNGWLPFYSLYRFYYNKGLYMGNALLNLTKKILKELVDSPDITFEELYKLKGTTLALTATKLSQYNYVYKSESLYLDRHTYPNMSVALACRMTASYPWVFEPVPFECGDIVDGGLLNNYPITYFDKTHDLKRTIGVKLLTDDEYDIIIKKDHHHFTSNDNLKSFTMSIIDSLYTNASKSHEHAENWSRTIPVQTGRISAMNMDITAVDKHTLYKSGIDAATKFLETIRHPSGARE